MDEKNTGKLILKTSLITGLCAVFIMISAFSLFTLVWPKEAGGLYGEAGLYGLSSRVTYAAYSKDKNKDINLLGSAAEAAILSKNDKLVKDYCMLLSAHKDYAGFARFKDELYAGAGYALNYDYYIKGHAYASRYKTGNDAEKSEAFAYVKAAVGTAAYPYNNLMTYLASAIASAKPPKEELLSLMFDYLAEAHDGVTTAAEKKAVCSDAYKIAAAHAAEAIRNEWRTKYERVDKYAILSIRKEFSQKILSGEKLYEFRKKAPFKAERIFIYETAPTKRVVGSFKFKVIKILQGTCGSGSALRPA